MKDKKKVILISVAVAALVILGGALVYFFVFRNQSPKKFYQHTVNEVGAIYQSQMDKMDDNYSGKIKMSFETDSKDKQLEILKDLDLVISFGQNTKDKKAAFNFETNYDGSELVDGTVLIHNDKLYMNLDDITNDFLVTNLDTKGELFQDNNENLDVIIEEITKAINDSFKDEYFSTSKDDGYRLYILDLNEENINIFVNDVITNLIESKDFVEKIAKIYGIDEKEITKNLEEAKEENIEGMTLKMTLFSKHNKIRRAEVSMNLDGTNIEYTLEEKSKDTTIIKAISDGEKLFEGTLNVKESKNKDEMTLSLDAKDIILNIGFTSEYNKEFKMPDVSKAKDMESLSESDTYNMLQKLYKKEGFVKLFTIINGLTNKAAY